MKILKPYERNRVLTIVDGPSMTKQAHRDEVDINRIMAKYEKTGLVAHVSEHQGRYEDVPGDLDYQKALNTVIAAEAAFDSLTAKVKKHFDNDPALFLAACHDPARRDELAELGLVPAASPPPAEPTPAPEGTAVSP